MSASRLLTVLRQDYAHQWRRAAFWIWLVILGLTTWLLSIGDMTIQSGDATVGGTRAWITSEFAVSMSFSFLVLLLYAFFVSVMAGMTVVNDDELRVGELLHATPLRPGEYVWGKFLATLVAFVVVLIAHTSMMAFFNHVVPNAGAVEVRGPFSPVNYLRPAILFGLPPVILLAGVAFLIGVWSRKPILVFLFPVALLFLCAFFLWDWSPGWLDPRVDRLLMVVDAAGFRWLNETWLEVDRGVDFYNTAAVGYDAVFLLNRVACLAVGFGAVLLAQRRFARTVRGARELPAPSGRRRGWRRLASRARAADGVPAPPPAGREGAPVAGAVEPLAPLAALAMRSRVPSLLGSVADVARFELRELRSQPGLYLFTPIILLQTIGQAYFTVGPFDTPSLTTPGTFAVRTMNSLTFTVCMLLMFYTVESLRRERSTGLEPIMHATPVRGAAVLLGKAMANMVVGVVIVLAALLGGLLVMLLQGKVSLDIQPLLVVWGLLLLPTFLVWTAFVIAVQAATGNRYTTYAICLGVFIFTLYRQLTGQMNWVGNWFLWSAVPWSDLGTLELDRAALVLNRLMALGLTVFFMAVAVRLHARRERDATATLVRWRPRPALRAAAGLLPYAVLPLAAGIMLYAELEGGFQGSAAEKAAKDYWRKNLATFADYPVPDVEAIELDLELEPARRWFRSQGSFRFVNGHDETLDWLPLTGGAHWDAVSWTVNGEAAEPEDRQRLYVFTPAGGLGPGESMRLGFEIEGVFPRGVTKNGGGAREFILPSGVVLTSFSPGVVPVPGFQEEIGVDEDNEYEAREYPDDFYEGTTATALGYETPFTTRIRITAPAEYTLNSVGTLVSEEVAGGRRTVVWESDHPVNFFNVVAGRWDVRRGQGTALFYHPAHTYNIEEMGEALDGARRYYSAWFYPFPWQELKVSEFPGLASYAQGFPTNITFSEAIGFLTRSDPRANAAFMVTAHETAHQWWGNILVPGEGPGAVVLSEGMSHFSTILLFEEIKGPRQRIEFCRRIEERYGDARRVDSERPLVKVDGSRPGDETVIYDKGGWVMWMLLQAMGRDAALAGLREFIGAYDGERDHPVLEDMIAVLRRHAPEPLAFDAFVDQWYLDVVVPEYRLTDAGKEAVGGGRMPVEIAARRGERFGDEAGDEPAPDAGGAEIPAGAVAARRGGAGPALGSGEDDGSSAPPAGSSGTTIELGPGESRVVTLSCDFEPDRIVVDPDALVLQLRREHAIVRF